MEKSISKVNPHRPSMQSMQPKTYAKTVIKRNGNRVPVAFDKITRRISGLSHGLQVEPAFVTQEVIKSMVDNMNVSEIDELAAQEAAFMVRTHVDYLTLSGRLVVSNLHKLTPSCFSDAMEIVNAQNLQYDISNTTEQFFSTKFMSMVRKHSKVLDAAIQHNADYSYDYFGIQTLLNGYLNKIYDKGTKTHKIIERPQYLLMRVALFLNMDDIPAALRSYQAFSDKLYTHASPTLFNAGKPNSQLASCFVAGTLVHTDRGPIPIERVQIGDKVITHKGNWKPVTQLHTNPLGGRTIYNLNSDFTETIKVTGNHRFWCVTPDNMQPHWIRVDQMPEPTFVALPNKTETAQLDLRDIVHIDGITFVKTQKERDTQQSTFPEYVYTLGVEDDHSYCAGGLMAENCFLLQVPLDSLDSIFDTLKQCAMISKHAGGIGLAVHGVRSTGALIKSSGGLGDGIVPMLRVFNNTARYVNQGGKRKGAFAIYLEPWHADIMAFIELKKNRGNEDERARDLHYAMWIPDLFMKRVESDQEWSLFSPDTAPGLNEVYGDTFETLYAQYEDENRAVKVVKARKIWEAILESQTETGEPYILYKDACNNKSNQKNLGTIQSSNLCAEILEYTSKEEIATCNLCSICLPSFLEEKTFNYQKLYNAVYLATQNLNHVIDLTYYPIPEAATSNNRHRPLGIGVQGLADVFCMLMLPFESEEARQLNRDIFETIYFAAVTASKDLAKQFGFYESFHGSPASQGLLQFDLWGQTPSTRWDWTTLKSEIVQHGMRNSLLVALMPTASTAQLMGNNEGCEPYTRNLYVRRTDAGEFIVVNRHLANILSARGMWTRDLIEQMVAHDGSIQYIEEIPSDIKRVFKTTFEVKSKPIIDMSADRGPYICQTQSMNLWVETPTPQLLNSIHFYGWKKGLKTGMYYLRSKSLTGAQKFVLDPKAVEKAKQQQGGDGGEEKKGKVYQEEGKTYVCTDDVCVSCGS